MVETLADLLERCRKGDRSAFEIIVKRYQGKALDLAKALIGDRHLAEDAVQEAFLTAFCRLDQLREPAAFVGWFRQIVRRRVLQIVSKNGQAQELVADYAVSDLSPSGKIELIELREMIRKALAELSEPTQKTAELFYLDEQSCGQVARKLDVPVGTVKRRLYDARGKLRDLLREYVEGSVSKRKKKRKTDRGIPL